ncbi:MAG TPA: DUF3025 domain-containing protein [Kofleriaceae bacterium]|nr:DUF3025 domain-containing protein [Kofleriaceae bacterium]
MSWEPSRWTGPRLAAYAPLVARLAAFSRWPSVDELDAVLADRLRAGRPVRLVAQPSSRAPDTLLYEVHVVERGEVPTREENPHDLWNALVWATFPRAKWALADRLGAIQRERAAAGPRLPGTRAPSHDRLAMLDEGGLIVSSGRAVVFGHAVLEHAARGIDTIRAARFSLPGDRSWDRDVIDLALASAITDGREIDPGPGIAIDATTLVPW